MVCVQRKPSSYPSPCETCIRTKCLGTDCEPWRIRYLYRQKQINAYAKKLGLTIPNERRGKDGK